MLKRTNWCIGILVIGGLLGWGLSALMSGPDEQAVSQESTVYTAPAGGDFTLMSQDGPFRLQDQRGKVVLIYFGYTFCPDICPTNLALMSQALNAMSDEELAGVQGLFVSVDPERDKLDRLKKYANHFHETILGVTGSAEEVAEVAKRYGAAYHKVEGESAGGYLIDHSSNTYVVAPDGALHRILPHATPSQEIVKITRELLHKSKLERAI